MREILDVGTYQELVVQRMTAIGAYLASAAGDILLPRKYLPAGMQPGDTARVFVYRDSADRLVATTRTPKAQVGEFAVLTVTDTGPVGAFLDWGLEKELLVPFSEQPVRMKKGERHLVRVYLDNSGRVAASARIDKFLARENVPLQVGDEVELILYAFTELGAKVVINGRYAGLLFRTELHGRPRPGTRLTGYVGRVRADNRIDVTLKRSGPEGVAASKERVMKSLAAAGGFLPLGDHSPPERIGAVLRMSKKSFKKAIGSLYKEGFIELAEDGIRLRNR